MSRLPRRPLAMRLAALAVGAILLAAAGVAATAGSASADTVLNVHYALTGTTFLKKLNTTVNLGSGTLAATVDLTTGASSSTLTLPPATASVKEFGVHPGHRDHRDGPERPGHRNREPHHEHDHQHGERDPEDH